jgi:flagellar L-ring protein precursor FlgH
MVADRRARSVGDIITILVEESSSASKDNSLKTAKKSGIDASISSFLYSPGASGLLTKNGQLPAIKTTSGNDVVGGGKINNAEKVSSRIAVRVMDVLPNNSFVIEGRRQTAFSGESQTSILRGVVRSEDISAANTVFSYNVADATISYIGKGSVADTQKKGWFTKTWDKLSPF